MDRHDEAVESFSKAIELAGRASRLLGYLGYELGCGGWLAEARSLLEELGERSRERYVPPYFNALIHMGLGERDRVFEQLQTVWEARDTMI